MRVLLLTDSYLPNRTSVARMIDELASAIRRRGVEVTIATSTRDLIGNAEVIVREDGVRICRVRAGKGDHISRVSRAFAELLLPFLMWRRAAKEFTAYPPTTVVYYSPTIFWGWLVLRLKARFHCRSYLILRDLFPQWAVDVGILSKRNPAFWLFRAIEKLQYRAADIIGVQSPSNVLHFRGQPALESKIEILWNWAATELSGTSIQSFRSAMKLEGKTVFFYGGNMGVAQRMRRLISLAESFKQQPQFHFVLVGEGSERETLANEVKARKLTNIDVLPPVSQEDFAVMLNEFDIGIVLLDPYLTTHNVPGKLISYAVAGKPILAEVNPRNDLIDLLHNNRAGLVSSNDESAFLLNAKLLAENSELRTELGSNSRRLAERLFSVESTADQILSHFSVN